MKKMILPNGIAVLEGDSHLTKWVIEAGRLDHDGMAHRLADMIPPGSVALDVGASIGDHTIAYLRRAAAVWAFEPNPVAFECLVHNCPNAICINAGLSSLPDLVKFVVSRPNYGASHFKMIGDTAEDYDFLCPILTLDSFNIPGRIGLIKVDIEGLETAFLHGGQNTIRKHKPILCMEVNSGRLKAAGSSPDELLSKLHVFGYATRPVGHYNDLQYDVLGIPT